MFSVRLMDGKGLGQRIPSAPTLSRWRGKMDVAFMLYFREIMDRHLSDGGMCSWILWDSSPQAGRDYENLIFSFVPVRQLLNLQNLIIDLDDRCRLLLVCCSILKLIQNNTTAQHVPP